MDDYKRSLYMEAKRRIAEGKGYGICSALASSIDPGTYLSSSHVISINTWNIRDIFPELFDLFDGVIWYPGYEHYSVNITQDQFAGFWWEEDWKEPRLRMIDCILNRDG